MQPQKQAASVREFVSDAGNRAQQGGEAIANYVKSDDFKNLLPYLLSGGTAAIAGGAMTGRRRKAKGESRLSHLRRVLTNAAVAGGLAGGGHLLLSKGLGSTLGSVGDTESTPYRDQSPAASALSNIAFSPVTAAASGAGTLALTSGRPLIGAGAKATEEALKAISDQTGVSAEILSQKTPKQIDKIISDAAKGKLTDNKGKSIPAADISDATRRAAGLPSARGHDYLSKVNLDKYKGNISDITRRNPIFRTLGQTTPRRIWRGGLGLAGAGLPALIGTLLPEKSKED